MKAIPRELVTSIISLEDPLQTAYTIANFQRIELQDAQNLLELDSAKAKLEKLVDLLVRETEVLSGLQAGDTVIVHPDDRERLAVAWRLAVETRGSFHVEFRLLHATGHYRHIESRAAPIYDEDGAAPATYRAASAS